MKILEAFASIFNPEEQFMLFILETEYEESASEIMVCGQFKTAN